MITYSSFFPLVCTVLILGISDGEKLFDNEPSFQPSTRPSLRPSSNQPSSRSSTQPTSKPSGRPVNQPSTRPSAWLLSSEPFSQPSSHPSIQPSSQPSIGDRAVFGSNSTGDGLNGGAKAVIIIMLVVFLGFCYVSPCLINKPLITMKALFLNN
jgi:hypothetical protein